MKYYLMQIHKSEIGSSSEYANNTFNLEAACPACKTGAQVIAPHKLKDISATYNRHLFSTYTRDHFISEMIFMHLQNFNINTDSLAKCVNQKGATIPFYHLRSDFIMPKPIKNKGFIQYDGHCLTCKRDHYSRVGKGGKKFGEIIPFVPEDIEITYLKSTLNKINGYDILFTFHCFAKSLLDMDGKIKVLPKPSLIISEKVRDAFTNFGIDYVKYWPVLFEDSHTPETGQSEEYVNTTIKSDNNKPLPTIKEKYESILEQVEIIRYAINAEQLKSAQFEIVKIIPTVKLKDEHRHIVFQALRVFNDHMKKCIKAYVTNENKEVAMRVLSISVRGLATSVRLFGIEN